MAFQIMYTFYKSQLFNNNFIRQIRFNKYVDAKKSTLLVILSQNIFCIMFRMAFTEIH